MSIEMDKIKHTPFYKIIEKLNYSVFLESETNLYIWENTLKRNILRAIEAIKINVYKPQINYKLDHWEEDTIKKNIFNLEKYIDSLYQQLEKDNMIAYCIDNERDFYSLKYEPNEMVLLVSSFYATIIYDILWSSNISVSDVINISSGIVDERNLLKKLPEMVNQIESQIIPFLGNCQKYVSRVDILKEAKLTYDNRFFKSTSSLILIAVEGLVRDLADFLIDKQNIDRNKLKSRYNSLDNLFREIPWKDDYEIGIDTLMFLNNDFVFHNEYGIDDKIYINLHKRLNFLKRRFRENRNSIIHGENVSFGETWDLYVNFSALNEVFETISYYEKKYCST